MSFALRVVAALASAAGLLLLAAALAAACSAGSSTAPAASGFQPGAATLLSTAGPTRDEDPSVLAARDGSLCIAWFSDRDAGNQEIYLARTVDGTTWSAPVRVTNDAGGDFYPNLLQDDAGTFHLVWFRWTALFVGRIMSKSAAGDCTQLAASAATEVTRDAGVDDWVPTLVQAPNGTLLVYFVSAKRDAADTRNKIYVTAKRPGDSAWSAPVVVADIAAAGVQDHLPFAARAGSEIALVWVRYTGSSATPWVAPLPKSDLWVTTSDDGLNWSAPRQVTNEPAPAVHLFPALYQRFDGSVWIAWLSTRLDPLTPTPALFEFPLAAATAGNVYPNGIERNAWLTAGSPGYSHRIARTATPGVYAGAWVHGSEPTQDIYYRFYAR